MKYTTIKELKAPTKVNSFLYLFDVIFVISYVLLMSMLKGFVYSKLVVPYYIYTIISAFLLTLHSPFNPGKRMFQSIQFYFIKSEDLYKPISIPKERKDK